MKLVLCRHGQAMEREDFAAQKKDDALRPLVQKGRERTKDVGKFLKKWNPDFDFIVTSPYLRAKQTAEILATALQISNVFEAAELVPLAQASAFAQWLKVHADESFSVLAIGHEPHLSTFASWCLVGGSESFIDLKKSGLITLDINSFVDIHQGSAKLEFLIGPKMLA